MEKTFQLDQKEQAMLLQVEQERTQALAMVGALSLDMEQAKKNLEMAQERQRSFLRQALVSRGVDRYENARAQNGALVVSVADAMPMPMSDAGPKIVERLNGPAIDAVKE
jgi:hypothetical protein